MSAYIIVDVKIHNTRAYEEYKKLTPASIEAYNGTFIVRGGATKTLEGDWEPGRIVIIEFPDIEKAMQWWNSTEYANAKLIRQGAATTKMILADGMPAT
jgi:uncharacterized protein (DUF1330 family)